MALQNDADKSGGSQPGQRPGPAVSATATLATHGAATAPAATPNPAATPGRTGGRTALAVDPSIISGTAGEAGVEVGGDGSDLDPTFRHSYSRDQAILVRRLRRIEGQVRGIERMIERREYCIDILQQTAALRAAVDSVALLILEDHVQGCVRTAAEGGDADRYIEEVLDVVRRAMGKPVRVPRV